LTRRQTRDLDHRAHNVGSRRKDAPRGG
jgi:hypothetical protein